MTSPQNEPVDELVESAADGNPKEDAARSGNWARIACLVTAAAGLVTASELVGSAWAQNMLSDQIRIVAALSALAGLASAGYATVLILCDKSRAAGVRRGMTVFGIQLTLTVMWSESLFRCHQSAGAMVIAVTLWLVTGWAAAAFWSVRDVAGALLMPSWAWATFAVGLNAAIWRVNGFPI